MMQSYLQIESDGFNNAAGKNASVFVLCAAVFYKIPALGIIYWMRRFIIPVVCMQQQVNVIMKCSRFFLYSR